jgi:hypothetical protein
MQRNFFIFLVTSIGVTSISYTASLIKLMETQAYSTYYIYLRFFLVGWVISSIIIGIAGDTKKIGGLKAFFISVFNPALGLIMVLASDRKNQVQPVNNMHYQNTSGKQKQATRIKNSSYTLNT